MIGQCPYPMPTAENVCSTEGLLYFVWEREAIRLARLNGFTREEWTTDPIFTKYKFTNIHRSDDRVSQWIIQAIIKPHQHRKDLWFTLLIARLINWPPTLQYLLNKKVIPCSPAEFNASAFVDNVEGFKGKSSKVYSGAYMVYPTKMDPGGVKSEALARHIIGSAVEKAEEIDYALYRTDHEPCIKHFVDALSGCFGISTFMAGQVAADLTYEQGPLVDACDLYSYAPMGPGSERGLNYLLGRKPFASWKQDDFNTELKKLFNIIYNQLGLIDLTLHDVQNIMCEFSKYCRAMLGEGKPKTTYQPEVEF